MNGNPLLRGFHVRREEHVNLQAIAKAAGCKLGVMIANKQNFGSVVAHHLRSLANVGDDVAIRRRCVINFASGLAKCEAS